jgi:autotransporter-associated beta strand protein
MGVALGNTTDNIINIDSTGGITISNIISGSSKKLTLGGAGTGTLTLSGVNTYSGDTTISSGKLALSGTGSIANSPNIVLVGGSTFDVSTLTTSLTLASGQGLKASGTTTTGTIATAAGKGLTTAANSPLQFTAFNGTTAPLTISGAGTVTLASGNPVTVTVSNGGTPLGAGAYTLIAKGASGTVAGTAPTSLTVNGDGLASGAIASLQITGGQLVLQVVSTTGKYRSRQSGNWNDFNTWQTDTGGGFVNAVSGQTPTSAADTIQIQSPHVVTVTTSVDADQLTVDSGSTVSVNNGVTFTIADGIGTDLTDNGTVATFGNITNNGQALINNTLQIEQGGFPGSGTGTYAYDQTNGVLVFNNTSGSFGVNNVNFWPTTNGPQNVNVKGAGGITMNVARTVGLLFQYAGGVSGAGNLTLNGTAQVNTGGFTSGSPTYGSSSLLKYNTGGTYGRNGEWLPNVTSGAGYPNNVQLSNNTVLDLANSSTTQPFQMAGTLTIDSGSTMQMAGATPLTQPLTVLKDVNITGTLSLSTAAGGDIKVGGNWNRAASGVFTPNGRAVTFNGAALQVMSVAGGGTETFNYLLVDKSGGNLTPNNSPATNLLVNATIGDVLQIINAGGINLNGQSLTMAGAGGNLRVSGGVRNILSTVAGGTFSFTGAKTIASTGGGTLVFGNNVNVTLQSAVDFGASLSTINGTLIINSGGSVNTNPPTYGNASTLKYNSGGTYGRGPEWSATSGAGFPNDVQLSNNTFLDLGSGGANVARSIAGSLTIDAGSTLSMNNGSNQMTKPLTIAKNITINGTLTPSVLFGADITVGGNWTRSAATGVFTPNGRAVAFNASTDQTITVTGGGIETFDYLIINKTGGDLVLSNAPATSVIINATSGDVLQLINTGGIKLNGQGMTLQNNGGNLLVGGAVVQRTITGPGTFAFTGSKTVTSAAGAKLSFVDNGGLNVNVLAGVNFGPFFTFLDGKMTIGSGGFVNANPPTYASTSTLIYDCSCVFSRSAEWDSVAGSGYPANVQVNSGTDVNVAGVQPAVARQISGNLDAKSGGRFLMDNINFPMTTTLTVLGNVIIETGGSLRLSTSAGGDLVTQGNFTNNGTFTPNNRAVFFTGGNTQTASDASGTLTMPYVRINKSGGTVQLNSNLTTLGPNGGDSVQFTGATSTLTLNGKTLTLGSTIGSISPGSGFIGSNSSGMSLQDGGAAGVMGTLVFVGGSESLQNLTMNRTGGAGSVTLGSPLTIGGTLTLTSGIINMGSNTLTLTDTATAARTAGYVTGNYKKIYSATGSFTYDVGTANGYSPLTANVTNLNGTSDLTVKPTQTAQPQIQTPGKALQRYWTLTEGGDLTADLTFSYLDPPDVPGTATETAFIVFKYDGSNFTTPTGVVDFINNKFTVPNVSSFSDWTLAEAIAPTAVKLFDFKATSNNGLVRVDWNTGYEARNLGFNLYREAGGKRTRITPSMLAGSALLTGPRSVLTAGHSYTWWDTTAQDAKGTAQYWVEDVDLDGTRTLHGPITPAIERALPRKTKGPQAEVLGQRQSFAPATGIQINGWPTSWANQQSRLSSVRKPPGADAAALQRNIAGMPGVKFGVNRSGWYRLTAAELFAAGLDPNASAANLRLYANGAEVPFKINGNGLHLNPTDTVEFYAYAFDTPTDGAQTYYLVQGNAPGKRIIKFVDKNAQPLPAPGGPDDFGYTVERKERVTFFPGLDNGDADNFYGQIITNDGAHPVNESLNVSHVDAAAGLAGESAQLEISLQGVTSGNHSVRVLFNGTDASVINFAGREGASQSLDVPASSIIEGDNNVQLISLGSDADISLVDTIRLTYAHTYVADNNALSIGVYGEETTRIKGFTGGAIRVVDITDPTKTQELNPNIRQETDGTFSADVQVQGATLRSGRTLLVFTDDGAAHPDSVRNSNPTRWGFEDAGADFLIVAHKDLMQSVQPLAQLRRSQGMTVDVIDVEDLYDEFSFGMHTPQAARDFIAYAIANWKTKPRYLLLVGDATYDPRNYLGQGANDMVPTKLLWATDMKTASDDWMADMDGDGVPELGVGRLPVRTVGEANTLVSKITGYVPGQSGQGALLIADHASDNDFEGASSSVGQQLPASVPVQVINRGTQDNNTVRTQIIGNINAGPQVVNYFGHGSVGLWTGAGLLTTGDAATLSNGNRLPVFTMMTCLNGYFHDVSGDSLAEALLKSQNGGAVAVWASSGLTDMNGQQQVAGPFYQLLFGGQPITLGDAVRGAKNATADQNVRRSWIFFGDPTQRIR